MRQITVSLTVAVAALALTAGCGSPQSRPEAPSPPAAVATTAVPATGAEMADQALTPEATTVARTDTAVEVYAEPGDATPSQTLPATTTFGSARALLVGDAATIGDDDWLQVELPTRPNGSTGWVRRDQVELTTVDEAVTIDLSARTLTLARSGEVVLTTPVAVGTAQNPTPAGVFYVVDKLDTGNPAGAYGPFAFGLSAHSDTLSEFGGGDGQVGIHGTNDPSSIGQARSHGCVRVPNEVAVELAGAIDLGTPVTIVE